jgi:hypothetical protein
VLVVVPPGKPVQVSLWHRRAPTAARVTLVELREAPAPRPSRPLVVYGNPLGLQAREQTAEERRSSSQAPDPVEGVVVLDVDPEGPAAGKLESGDLIVEVDHRPVKRLVELRERLQGAQAARKPPAAATPATAASTAAPTATPATTASARPTASPPGPPDRRYTVLRFQRGDARFYTAIGLDPTR